MKVKYLHKLKGNMISSSLLSNRENQQAGNKFFVCDLSQAFDELRTQRKINNSGGFQTSAILTGIMHPTLCMS